MHLQQRHDLSNSDGNSPRQSNCNLVHRQTGTAKYDIIIELIFNEKYCSSSLLCKHKRKGHDDCVMIYDFKVENMLKQKKKNHHNLNRKRIRLRKTTTDY